MGQEYTNEEREQTLKLLFEYMKDDLGISAADTRESLNIFIRREILYPLSQKLDQVLNVFNSNKASVDLISGQELLDIMQTAHPRTNFSKAMVNKGECPHCGSSQITVSSVPRKTSKVDEIIRTYKCRSCCKKFNSIEIFFHC